MAFVLGKIGKHIFSQRIARDHWQVTMIQLMVLPSVGDHLVDTQLSPYFSLATTV